MAPKYSDLVRMSLIRIDLVVSYAYAFILGCAAGLSMYLSPFAFSDELLQVVSPCEATVDYMTKSLVECVIFNVI